MKGFGIYVKNDLLDPKHYKNMGNSIWVYLWLLDRMTSISEDGIGKVLGGKPVTHSDISTELPMPERTYRKCVGELRKHGYINTIRTPYGLSFTINKAKKPFKRDVQKTARDVQKGVSRYAESAHVYRQYKDNTKTIGKIIEERATRATAIRVRKELQEKGVI